MESCIKKNVELKLIQLFRAKCVELKFYTRVREVLYIYILYIIYSIFDTSSTSGTSA